MKEIDFALSWDKNKCLFTRALESDLKRKGCSFLLVTIANAREVIRKLEANEIRIALLLDTEATYDVPGDIYARLAYGFFHGPCLQEYPL